jgi:hypothetical protein
MKIENAEVYGFRAAFRGLRNPYNSWDKSDSVFQYTSNEDWYCNGKEIETPEYPQIGPNDLTLACKLIKAGGEHRKFLRQIQITFDIQIPIYIWSEFDTYKVATVRNSCSTMHTLGLRDLTQDDFELGCDEDYLKKLNQYGEDFRNAKIILDSKAVSDIRQRYKNALPSGFLQKATYSMNYETALNMYFQRRNHRLPEWAESNPESICSFLKSLPYMSEFIQAGEK